MNRKQVSSKESFSSWKLGNRSKLALSLIPKLPQGKEFLRSNLLSIHKTCTSFRLAFDSLGKYFLHACLRFTRKVHPSGLLLIHKASTSFRPAFDSQGKNFFHACFDSQRSAFPHASFDSTSKPLNTQFLHYDTQYGAFEETFKRSI